MLNAAQWHKGVSIDLIFGCEKRVTVLPISRLALRYTTLCDAQLRAYAVKYTPSPRGSNQDVQHQLFSLKRDANSDTWDHLVSATVAPKLTEAARCVEETPIHLFARNMNSLT